jgi:hypothetical protein
MENELSYQKKQGKGTLKSHGEVLQFYKENIQKAINLSSEFPMFFDTNVLLRTYSISFKAREKLLDFYNKQKKEIYLTNYIQTEFIKNREDVINKFFDNVTNKLPNDFRSEVISQIGSYLDKNKIIFKDYDSFESELIAVKTKFETLHNELLEEVGRKEQENSNLIFEDRQLSILSESNCLESLSETEIRACNKEYDFLAKDIEPEKINSILNKSGKVFPGMGDLKEKPENPYGDYLIFYELMKFSKKNKKNIIFLTYDTTKGDWMRKDKKPHLHYIENFYLNTGQMIFILDAERIFEELLDISFKSLIQVKNEERGKIPITIESLSTLLSNRFASNSSDGDSEYLTETYFELIENGYRSIDKIIFDLNKADTAFEEYLQVEENSVNRFSRIGNLRIRLYMSNPNYRVLNDQSNTYEMVDKNKYKPFLHLLK